MNYNWKDLLDNWYAGIEMSIEELKDLSDNMECNLDEKYWIDLYIENELRLRGDSNE